MMFCRITFRPETLVPGLVATFGIGLATYPLAAAVVINEIHYNPDVKTEPAEFVELHNTGPQPVNLLGWRFSNGLSFTFPSTNLPPGGFVVVAQNPTFFQTKFGLSGALGPFNADGTSGLSSRGETITLRNSAGQVVDEVTYQLGFPWPTVGDATAPGTGKSIELIHPALDNDLGSSWRPAGSGSGGTPAQNVTLVPAQATWRYAKGTNEVSSPATLWRQSAFSDAAWSEGPLPIGYGETFIATALPDMSGGYSSVFLRKHFTVANPAQFNSLLLEAQYDDGFKAWINGGLVVDGSANMTVGEVPFNGTAVSALENLNFVGFNLAALPASVLVAGANTLAIQAHNSSISGSSDFFFDARLIGQIGATGGGTGPTPGRINSVFATNAPPQIRQVDHSPNEPNSGAPVTITAKVTDPQGVASVTLAYQVVLPGQYIELTDAAYTNAANWVSVPMNDAGTDGDAVPGDEVFTARIPAFVQQHRRLVRYRITVTDALGRSALVPYADDPQPNFAYFVHDGVPGWSGAVRPGAAGAPGAVVNYSSNTMGRLPVFHLIGRSNTIATATWFSRYGGDAYQWLGTLVYDGKVLDHVRYRARGGVWRYSMTKNMWKFDLNRGHDLEMRDNWGRKYSVPWTKLNLGACIQQGDFNHRGEQGMFESVGFRLFNLAGVAAPHSTFSTFRVIDDAAEASPSQFEGDFWGVYLAIEQENGRFLEEHGLPDGNLYKMEGGTGELNNLGPSGPTDKSDLTYLQANYTGATEPWWRTNWNLRSHYSYQAIVQGIHHYDIADGKNYFFYRNPATRLWETCTWDLDLTWADNMYRAGQTGGDEPLKSRLLDNFASPGRLPNVNVEFRNRVREIRDLLWNTDQAYALIDEYADLVRGPTNVPTILDADRSMWDYNPKMIDPAYSPNSASKAGQGRFYQWPNQTPNPANLPKTFAGGVQLLKSYVDYRATNAAFSLDTISADNARPARPTLAYTGPSGFPLNQLTFRSSAYTGANAFRSLRWRVGEVTVRTGEPRRYEIEPVWESGDLSPFTADITIPADVLRVGSRYRVRVLHTDQTGRNSNWSQPIEFTCGDPINEADLINHLRITEILFNPAPGGYEYVELFNTSPTLTLRLAGVKFTQGIDYTFPPGTVLPPGGYLVVAGTADLAAFRAYHQLDDAIPVYGPFSGSLNNAGEALVLRTAAGGHDIVNFSYGDGRGWPVSADGAGHALIFSEPAVDAQNAGSGDYAGNWRPSSFLRGSPGRADSVAPASPVLNEIVAHTDFVAGFDSNDWIELYNPTDSPITLGDGWFLSDDGSTYLALKKWAIPANTTIPARGWVAFDEVTGFHNPTNIGFGLNKAGEQVFLSHLPGNASDRVVDAFSFKGQENDWSLGRYPDGAPDWFALTPRTRSAANSPPAPAVIVSEVLFHPPDLLEGTNRVDNSLDEFIELHNSSASPVTLANTNGPWRLNGGVEFVFAGPVTLAPGEYLLVANFDPATNAVQLAAFKAVHAIAQPGLQIVGPYVGKLANNSDRVALEKPQAPDLPGDAVSWVIVDEVLYADQSPWPCGADGSGNSIQRLSPAAAGSQPFNWSAEPPTAGRARVNLPAGLPAIIAQPQPRVAPTNGSASFSVAVCGTPPFTFQWRFNSLDLPGATNATLTLVNLDETDAGDYTVVVANAAGATTSDPATLVVQFPPVITEHPQPTTTIRDQSASFTATAGGTPPFSYQWRFNGVAIASATNQTLALENVQASQAGAYSVLVQNTAGSALSASANLTVLIPATVTTQPTNLTVRLGTTPTNATFSVVAVGTGPLHYQWLFNSVPIPGATSPNLTLVNVQVPNEGVYRVRVTDDIGPALSDPATLTILVTPRFVIQPVSQSVIAGAPVTLSVGIEAHPRPFAYEWRRGSLPLATNESVITTDFFTFNAPSTIGNQTYRAVVRNAASPSGVASAQATITTLADFDSDGLADVWEIAAGLNTNNAADATLDTDRDGQTNRDEYLAGTDPLDPQSYLRVTNTAADGQPVSGVRIEFNAVVGRTYSILGTTNLHTAPWTRVADVPANASTRLVEIIDLLPSGGPRKFYRLVTPRSP